MTSTPPLAVPALTVLYEKSKPKFAPTNFGEAIVEKLETRKGPGERKPVYGSGESLYPLKTNPSLSKQLRGRVVITKQNFYINKNFQSSLSSLASPFFIAFTAILQIR